MFVYRLCSRRYPANDGLGASLYGGRWNHKGTPVIYASASRALCALEVMVNLRDLANDYVVIAVELPDDLTMTRIPTAALPRDWAGHVPSIETADYGTQWARELGSAVLIVPSAIIPQEQNYILNPRHPEFARLQFRAPEPFSFDERLRHAWRNM